MKIRNVLVVLALLQSSMAFADQTSKCNILELKIQKPEDSVWPLVAYKPNGQDYLTVGVATLKKLKSHIPPGTIDQLAMIATCDYITPGPRSEIFIWAPVTGLIELQQAFNTGKKISLTAPMLESGILTAINGKGLGQIQPFERRDLAFEFTAGKNNSRELGEILQTKSGVSSSLTFEAKDSALQIDIVFTPSHITHSSRGTSHVSPDAFRIYTVGYLNINQNPGDDIILSKNDSQALTTLWGIHNFPFTLNLEDRDLFHAHQSSSATQPHGQLVCQSSTDCEIQVTN